MENLSSILGSQSIWPLVSKLKMYSCQNCGHESHCGVPLRREEKNGRGKFIGEIEVCKQCRCYNCTTKTDWG